MNDPNFESKYRVSLKHIQDRLVVNSLKAILRQLRIAASGRKAHLQTRLTDYLNTGYRRQDEARIANVYRMIMEELNPYTKPPHPSSNPFSSNNLSSHTLGLPQNGAVPPALTLSSHRIPSANGRSQLISSPTRGNAPSAPAFATRTDSQGNRISPPSTNSALSPVSQTKIPPMSFRESPFFRLHRLLTDPILVPINTSTRKVKTSIRFVLSDSDIGKIKFNQCVVLLLAAPVTKEKSEGNLLQYPSYLELSVNQHPQSVSCTKGIKGKKGTAQPPNITRSLTLSRLANIADIFVQSTTEEFAFFVHLAKLVSMDELVQVIKSRPVISKESTIQRKIINDSNDDDIQTISAVLSLKCPLSYCRINIPVRSIQCDHMECFDALSYLQLQQQATTWSCPICNKSVDFSSLRVDEYVQEILQSTALYDIDHIIIESNGEWAMPEGAKLLGDGSSSDNDSDSDGAPPIEPARRVVIQTEEIITLSDSDDDNFDEPVQLAPRSAQRSASSAQSTAPIPAQPVASTRNLSGAGTALAGQQSTSANSGLGERPAALPQALAQAPTHSQAPGRAPVQFSVQTTGQTSQPSGQVSVHTLAPSIVRSPVSNRVDTPLQPSIQGPVQGTIPGSMHGPEPDQYSVQVPGQVPTEGHGQPSLQTPVQAPATVSIHANQGVPEASQTPAQTSDQTGSNMVRDPDSLPFPFAPRFDSTLLSPQPTLDDLRYFPYNIVMPPGQKFGNGRNAALFSKLPPKETSIFYKPPVQSEENNSTVAPVENPNVSTGELPAIRQSASALNQGSSTSPVLDPRAQTQSQRAQPQSAVTASNRNSNLPPFRVPVQQQRKEDLPRGQLPSPLSVPSAPYSNGNGSMPVDGSHNNTWTAASRGINASHMLASPSSSSSPMSPDSPSQVQTSFGRLGERRSVDSSVQQRSQEPAVPPSRTSALVPPIKAPKLVTPSAETGRKRAVIEVIDLTLSDDDEPPRKR